MPSFQPYQDSYHSKKRKTHILIAVLAVSALVILIFFLSNSRKDPRLANIQSPAEENPAESATEVDSNPKGAENENRGQSNELQDEFDSLPKETASDPPPADREATESEDTSEEWISDVDRIREQGLRDFDEAIQKCLDKRDRLATLRTEYNTSCTGTVFDAYGNPIVNATTPRCRELEARINRLQTELNRELDQAEHNARKAGLYPGQIRDVKEKYDFKE